MADQVKVRATAPLNVGGRAHPKGAEVTLDQATAAAFIRTGRAVPASGEAPAAREDRGSPDVTRRG